MINNMLQTILSLFAVCIILSLIGFFSAIFPIRIKSHITPDNYNINYEPITLTTSDHVRLSGWFIPNKNPHAKAIILMHGYPADKGNILPITIFLHQQYHLLYFDFRRLGDSGGAISTVGKREQLDFYAAVNYLKQRGIKEIGVWGFSMGGAVALMYSAKIPEIRAIISDSSYARLDWIATDYYQIPVVKYFLGGLTRLWGLIFLGYDIKQVAPVAAVSQLNIPILLIHSVHDPVVPYKHALALRKALANNKNVTLITTSHLDHGEMMKEYDKTILSFFNMNLHSIKN